MESLERFDQATAVPVVADAQLTYGFAKRTLDVVLSAVTLAVMLPVMFMLSIVIVADSRGSAIFAQQRVGRNGRPFVFYKFRTMRVDARELFPELYSYRFTQDDVESMYFKHASDPRLTRFGKILRRTSLDELPNLWNVLRGDMSLVGPRPEIPEMVTYYRSDQLAKFSVKPGLTGLAQINGRNILRFQETIAMDLDYVRRRSLTTDLAILLKTPLVVLRMWGAL